MINFDENKYPNPNRSFVLKQLGGQTKQQTNIFDKQANRDRRIIWIEFN